MGITGSNPHKLGHGPCTTIVKYIIRNCTLRNRMYKVAPSDASWVITTLRHANMTTENPHLYTDDFHIQTSMYNICGFFQPATFDYQREACLFPSCNAWMYLPSPIFETKPDGLIVGKWVNAAFHSTTLNAIPMFFGTISFLLDFCQFEFEIPVTA